MTNLLTAGFAFRCTPGEKAALEALAKKRGADMAERGEIPDDSPTGFLRAVIRREAKAADIPVDEASPPAPAKKALRKRVAR